MSDTPQQPLNRASLRALLEEVNALADTARNRTPAHGDDFHRGYMAGGAEAFAQVARRLSVLLEARDAERKT